MSPPLDGAVPLDARASQDVALATLARRVTELEHRLNVMKVIVGLVLAAKVLLVCLFLYVVFGGALGLRGGGAIRATTQSARPV